MYAELGADAVLVGESLVTGKDPRSAVADLVALRDGWPQRRTALASLVDTVAAAAKARGFFAAIDAGCAAVRVNPGNIKEFDGRVGEVAKAARPLVERQANDFRISVPEDIPDLCSDRSRLRQCLLNLLSNASKFTSSTSS